MCPFLLTAISCRKEHRNSIVARFTKGFDDTGMPIARSGHMVPCRKQSDCNICGRHPLTGQHYQCQKRHVLYDTVLTGENSFLLGTSLAFINVTDGAASAFDPDMEEAAIDGKVGVCVDIDSSYNQGCGNKVAALIKDGFIGCMDQRWTSYFTCGITVEIKHGDLSTVQQSGNLGWPRVLLDGTQDTDGDGRAGRKLECTDPADCLSKCAWLDRTSSHGTGAPPSCALCGTLSHALTQTLTTTSLTTRMPCTHRSILPQQPGVDDRRPGARAEAGHPHDRVAHHAVLCRPWTLGLHLSVCGVHALHASSGCTRVIVTLTLLVCGS